MIKFFNIIIVIIILLSQNVFADYKTNAKQAILFDYDTGQILFEYNSSELMAPSSMVKMMTTYIAFSAIQKGELKLDDKILISEKAWRTLGSRMFLKNSESVTVEDLLKGIIVQSGNDACVALSEGMFGDENTFVRHMNATAQKLGMSQTNFTNSNGLPDETNLSTAKDLGRLSRSLIKDFPEYYHYHAIRDFEHNNIKQPNRNVLLGKMGIDGIKTGHTDAGGFGIALSAINNDTRLIAVINGLNSMKDRAIEGQNILNYGFNNFKKKAIIKSGAVIAESRIFYGDMPTVSLITKTDLMVLVPKILLDAHHSSCEIEYKKNIKAPIEKGAVFGILKCNILNIDGNDITVDLIAATAVEKANFIQHILHNLDYLISYN